MPDARAKHVFISIGGRYTSDQEAFLRGLQDMLLMFGVTPHVMNVTDYPTGNPLKGILQVMRKCHGAMVVVFERKYFETGLEYRGSSREKKLNDVVRLPTPFNHIETAIAFTLGIPILVLCEPGIYPEGLLEDKFDWYVHETDIRPDCLSERGLRGRVQAWCESLVTSDRSETATLIDDTGTPTVIDTEKIKKMTLSDLAHGLSIGVIAGMIVTISVVFSAGVTAGKWLQEHSGSTAATQQHP